MKKLFFSSLFIVLSLLGLLALRVFMPKNSVMLSFFFFYLLFDGYLWLTVRGSIKKYNPVLQALTTVAYWLPLALTLNLILIGLFIPFLDWNLPFRTYVQSFVLTLFLTKVFPMLTLLVADIIRLKKFTFMVNKSDRNISLKSIPRMKPLLVSGWLMAIFVFMVMMYGAAFSQFDFVVRKQTITLPELPSAFNGFQIVQISDIHLGSWGSKKKLTQAMNQINALKPDVIFFTGDMFNYRTADGDGFQEILHLLRAPYGIFAIMGNHDYGDYISWSTTDAKRQNMEDVKAYYHSLRWHLLLNSHAILKRGSDSIAIIGVENWGATHRFQRLGDIDKAQQGTENMAIQLLLSHDPSHWDSIVSKKYPKIDVTFSGHTHGGQIGIDCCNIHWSPVIWISRLWSGLYQNPGSAAPQYLFVNQGLGNIGYSGRIGILPEITLITLKTPRP